MNKILVALIFSLLFNQTQAQQKWQNVDRGVGFAPGDQVNALVTDSIHHYLYVAGKFDSAGSIKSKSLARWNTNHWETIGNRAEIKSMCMYNNNLVIGYVANSFGAGIDIEDSTGKSIGGCLTDGTVNSLCVYNGKLYAGGDFEYVTDDNNNKIHTEYIACYDGVKWSAVGRGIYWSWAPGKVWAMGIWNDKLYVGGAFDEVRNDVGEIAASSIAAWDGTSWSALGNGIIRETEGPFPGTPQGYVNSICSYNNSLYVGGEFDSAGGVLVNNIGRWDGANWYSLGDGTEGPFVFCMTVKDSDLYVGGDFQSVYLANTSSVAKWNGKNWSQVGPGFGGQIYSMSVYDSTLYLRGRFRYYLDPLVNNIIRLVKDIGDGAIVTSVPTNSEINVYPNPASDKLDIEAEGTLIEEVQISNVLRQSLMTMQLSQTKKETEIDVSNLPRGIYLLRVKTKEGWSMGKFVKE